MSWYSFWPRFAKNYIRAGKDQLKLSKENTVALKKNCGIFFFFFTSRKADFVPCDRLLQKFYYAEYKCKKVARTYLACHLVNISWFLTYFRRLMFWTDWGEQPEIEQQNWTTPCNRQAIISQEIGWPNGITIDYSTEKIWGTDAKLFSIAKANFH